MIKSYLSQVMTMLAKALLFFSLFILFTITALTIRIFVEVFYFNSNKASKEEAVLDQLSKVEVVLDQFFTSLEWIKNRFSSREPLDNNSFFNDVHIVDLIDGPETNFKAEKHNWSKEGF